MKADDLKAESTGHVYQNIHSKADYVNKNIQTEDTLDLSNLINGSAGYPLKINFSFPASYLKQKKDILLYSIHTSVPMNVSSETGGIAIKDQNNNLLGHLAIKQTPNKVDYILKPETNKQYTGTISGSFDGPVGLMYSSSLSMIRPYMTSHNIQLGQPFDAKFYDQNNSLLFTLHLPSEKVNEQDTINNDHQENVGAWRNYAWAGYSWSYLSGIKHDGSNISTIDSKPVQVSGFHQVMEVSGPSLKISDISMRAYNAAFRTVDANGHTTDETLSFFDFNKYPSVKELTDNLTPQEVYDQTPIGSIGYSKHSDTDYIIAFNLGLDYLKMTDQQIKNTIKNNSLLYNLQDPAHQEEILKNNLKYYNDVMHNIPTSLFMDVRFNTPDSLMLIRNETPNGSGNFATGYVISNNGQGAGDLLINSAYQFIDDTTGSNVGSAVIKSGKTGDHGSLSLTIPSGYKLAKNQTLPTTYNILDHNTLTLIHLVHSTQKKNNSSGVGIRKITYTGASKNPDPVTQTVHFSRTDTVDDATDKVISSSNWQPTDHNGQWDAVNTPIIAGYKPDKVIVPADKASVGTTEVKVTYSKADQHAKLTVHDDTANTDLNDYAENSTGLYQDQINFKTAPSAVEQELKDKGYNIVSDSFKGSPTYNADDSKNNFVIHVTHKIVPVTPDQPKTPTDVIPDTKQHYPTGVDTNDLNKDVQRSIFYKYEDNTQAEPTVVQKAHFGRTVKVDAVTQKIVDNGTWATKDNYPEVATKSIDGYTPDKTKVDSATPSMTTNQDQTVVYHANDEDAAITYIDDTTGKVLKTDTQKAKYKQTIKFTTDPNTQIQAYKDQGYVLVSSDWKDGSTYQTDPARNKFTVHLKHGTSTVTPDKPKKPTDIIPGTKQHYPTGVDTNDLNQPQQRQITYTYADSKKQASPTVTQKSTFHRTATVDNVTGKTTYTDWITSDQYPEVKSPTIEGYTPDKSNVPVTKPVLNTKQDVAVVYNPNPEQVDVIAQDNTGKQLSKSTLHGNYNTDYTATTPVIKGYHLIKMPTNTHGTYKTHNDPIIYIYAPDSNSVPEQTDGTPKPDKSSYPDDITPAKRSPKLPETGSTTLASELKSEKIYLQKYLQTISLNLI